MRNRKFVVLLGTLMCVLIFAGRSYSQTTFKSGTAIIDMGSASPTVANSLKPYGLIYALLKNNHVPVSYVVNSTKAKDGIDFVYNGKSYKGGTFIISSDYISSTVASVLTNWANQGVLIDYTNSDLTVTVTQRINFVPKWAMDKTNGSIAVGFLTAAGIPSSAYSYKTPAQLSSCDDIFVLPHADPDWTTHGSLYDFVRTNKSALWAGCHAVSVMESLVDNQAAPTKRLNFLSTNGLIPFTDHNAASTPFANLLPGDPVAQYFGSTDNAQLNGSETVYLPKAGSSWNAGAKILTTSPGQQDVPALSAGAAVENIYGRAFDNNNYGYVAYQAAHNIGGTGTNQIAAQRIFFNFSLYALSDKIPPIITANLNGQTDLMTAGVASGTMNATATGSGTGFTYQWSASVAGTFSNPNSATTTFTPSAAITSATPCIFTVVVTESCGRISFESKKVTIIPPPSGHTLTNIDITKNIPNSCASASITFNVFDGNPDPDAGTRTLLSVTGLAGGSVITKTNGDITYTVDPNNPVGTTGTFIVTNGISNSPSKTITITVGTSSPVPAVDAVTAMADQVTQIDVLTNDAPGTGAAGLYIKDIVGKPTKGYAYINANGTLSYLSKKDPSSVGADVINYLACNDLGSCAVGTVNVTLVQDACAAGQYQLTTTGTTTTVILNPVADSYLDNINTPNNYGADNNLNLDGWYNGEFRPIMRFDLTSIPTSATVLSASLSLTFTSTYNPVLDFNSFPATIYGLSQSWTEGTGTSALPGTQDVSFDNYSGTSFWNNGGGDYTDLGINNPVFASLSNGGHYTQIVSSSLTSLVQPWITTPASNNGLLIVGTGQPNQNTAIFYSREGGTSSQAPQLKITYSAAAACNAIPTNYAPILYPDATVTSSNLSVTVSPLINDINYYGHTNSLQSVTTPPHGIAVISGNTVIYTPNGSFIGTDTLTYTVKDATNDVTSTGVIRINVTRVGPTVVADIATTPSNTAKTIAVGANDFDNQGAMTAPSIVSNPANGTITVVGTDIVYTPSSNFVGTDVFTYRRFGTATDACSAALSGTASVTVTVTNQPPVAGPGAITTFACVTGTVTVANIASDPESGTLSATIAGAPSHGTAIVKSDGTISYSPTTNYTGNDAFTYTVTDPLGLTSAAATVSITVSGAANPNIAPVAVNDADNTLQEQPVYTNVLFNDSDPNNDALSVSITAAGLTAPLSGTISLMPNKLVKYTPNAGFTGTDTYQYQLSDTHPGCAVSGPLTAVATVTITVKAVSTSLSGTVWNDADVSGTANFTNIKTNTETGTNGNGSTYIYLTNASNVIIDKTPVDIDGTYLLSSVPASTTGLTLILSAADLTVGSTLTTGSLPNGYSNSSPLIRSLPLTTIADMGPYDWGIYSNPLLTAGTVSGALTICGTSGDGGTFKAVSNASGGSITATGYVYQWQSSTTSPTGPFADIPGANGTEYSPGTVSATTYYRRKVTTNMDGAVYSNVLAVVLTAKPTVGISPVTSVIGSGTSKTITASGGDTYSWTPAATLSASNTASVTATPTVTTAYTVTVTIAATGCSATGTATITVINPGTIGTNQANCGGFTPAALTSVADASGSPTITYQWQSSITSSSTGFANIAGATATSYTPSGAITTTTWYKRIATADVNSFSSNVVTATVNTNPTVTVTPTSAVIAAGATQTLTASGADSYQWTPSATLSSATGASVVAAPAVSTNYTVTGTVAATNCLATATAAVAVINPGTIGSNQVNCGPFLPAALTSVADASGALTITYQWQASVTSSTAGFNNIAGATATSYAPSAAITATTYYRRVATYSGTSFNSNVITAIANTIPTVAISPSSVSVGSGLTQTLSASGADTYSWTPSATLSSSTTAVVVASPLTTTTYTVTGTISASGCSSTSASTVTVVALGTLVPGTIGSPQTICSLATPGAFTSTGASGGLGTINYQWQSSTDNVTFTNITGATSATYSAPALSATTYYRRAASTSSNAAVYTSSVKVTVLPKPVVGPITGPCALPKDSTKTFSVTAVTNATSYLWTVPSGWSGTSTTNSINVKAGTTNGNITVTPYNIGCAGNTVSYAAAIIDYAKVTITGTPVSASGNNNNPITVTIQLIDVLGNLIHCSGGTATLCTNSGTFSSVVDNNDGTYTSTLVSTANDVRICGTVAGVTISNTTTVTFTGPQGGIKSNGPILATEIPKVTFTATAGRAPFTVIYHSAKSAAGINDTLKNVTSGVPYDVAQIPSTTLYTLVSVIDANGERRDNNFIRDTTTTIVLAPKVIITLKADPAKQEKDSSWATRIVVVTKNIGDLDLSNSQARLNLHDVFPSPVTYVLDSVKVSGTTVVPNTNYDGVNSTDLFARVNRRRPNLYTTAPIPDMIGVDNSSAAPDGSKGSVELWSDIGSGNTGDEQAVRVSDDGHSVYMFGPLSNLPVGVSAEIILWLHVRPNGYTEPFIMQAVALGTGHTKGATALTTSLSNDNNDVSQHPEVTHQGTPLPAVINLFPTASIGAALTAGTPVLQGDGTYNVLLTYNLKNYGNLNLRSVNLYQSLITSIASPAAFTVVGGVTASNNLFANPAFDGKTDSNLLVANTSILGYKQSATISYTINIAPNQLSAIYRLQARATGYSDDLAATVTDLSTDGTNPDPDGDNIPSEKIITVIVINLPVPPLVPGTIGIKTGPTTTVLANGYCPIPSGIVIIPTSQNSGGIDAYQYQWQKSTDNVSFTDIAGATDSIYTTAQVQSTFYLRRGTISANQVKYSNSVTITIYPAPAVPVITGTGTQVVGTGNLALTSTAGSAYLWSTGATTRSIVATGAGSYTVQVTDANGCSATSLAYTVTAIDPSKVADIQKILSRPVTPQPDGSYTMGFTIYAANLRTELLDTVRIKDDLSKVFPSTATFQVVDLKASGKLLANSLYNGNSVIDMLTDVSQLAGSKTDSVELTLKVFPNGFSGKLNNTATLQARSPLGFFTVTSNDPTVGPGTTVRNPTPFIIPITDIFIPGGFSPNHDGVNDLFVIQRPYNTTINFELFNRWGNLVYRSPAPDYKNDFDGHGNQDNRILGDELPDGTYYYVVLATDKNTGAVRKFAGFITLKR